MAMTEVTEYAVKCWYLAPSATCAADGNAAGVSCSFPAEGLRRTVLMVVSRKFFLVSTHAGESAQSFTQH